MKKIHWLTVLLIVALSVLAACTPLIDNSSQTTAGSDTTAAAVETGSANVDNITFISATGENECNLIRTDVAASEITEAFSDMFERITEMYKNNVSGIGIKSDWEKPGTDPSTRAKYEILVGKTNREESITVWETLGVSDYAIIVKGSKLVICGGNDESTLQAIGYFIGNYLKEEGIILPADHSYICTSPPRVLSTTPENCYFFENSNVPEVKIKYYCSPEIDFSKSTYAINGEDFTSRVIWDKNEVVLKDISFETGRYKIELNLVDTLGHSYKYSREFGCGSTSEMMNLYKGEVHAHTSESDGQGTVEDAYKYARDVAKLDFFSITDHSNSINLTTYQNVHITVADAYNEPGKYVTLYGYEQTYNNSSGFFGHLNTLNTSTLTTRTLPLLSYYKVMATTKTAIVMFNHPGYKWGNFLEYEGYTAEADSVVNLAEIKGAWYDNEYALCLSKGWHVSPVHNEDNHSPNWGTANEAVGYALSPALTRENIVSALSNNRTYSTTDGSLKIYYKINGEWMGSRLNNPSELKVSIDITTTKSSGLGIVNLIGEDNITVASKTLGTTRAAVVEFTLPVEYDYYYVKVEGESIWAITAPIWIENRDLINISSLSQSLIKDNEGVSDYTLNAVVKNSSSKVMTDVVARFYRSSLESVSMVSGSPFSTVNVGTIEAGKTVDVSALTSYNISEQRISVIVSGKVDGVSYSDTSYAQLTNALITEIVPMSNFEYIELYNNSDVSLPLGNYTLRYHPKAGAATEDLASATWKLSGSIAPHSAMVVWIKPNTSTATLAKFNEYYKTSLTEGVDIITISTSVLIPDSAGKSWQVELLSGATVVSRAWYNWGTDNKQVTSGKVFSYNYQTMFTLTNILESTTSAPTPGTINAGQIPELLTYAQWAAKYKVQAAS